MTAARTTELWVYAGERRGKGGKTVHEWWDIDENKSRWFAKNLVTAAGVGGLYEVTTTTNDDGGTTVHGDPTYCGMWHGHDEDETEAGKIRGEYNRHQAKEQIAAWHAEHRGWQAARAIERQRATDKKDAPQIFDMTLKEIRDKIMSTNYSTAEGIMGAVVAYLGQGIR